MSVCSFPLIVGRKPAQWRVTVVIRRFAHRGILSVMGMFQQLGSWGWPRELIGVESDSGTSSAEALNDLRVGHLGVGG